MMNHSKLIHYFIEERNYQNHWESTFERVDDRIFAFSKEDWIEDLFESLWFSYSSLICAHFVDHEADYRPYFQPDETVEEYGDRFVIEKGQIQPFVSGVPYELDRELNEIATYLMQYTEEMLANSSKRD